MVESFFNCGSISGRLDYVGQMTCGLIKGAQEVGFGDKYVECDFTPQEDFQSASNFVEARGFTKLLLEDSLSLIELVKNDPRFEDLKWIIAPTNPRMAKLLMRKFRFNRINNKLSEFFPDAIYVAIHKDDLVSQQAQIKDFLVRFKLRNFFRSQSR